MSTDYDFAENARPYGSSFQFENNFEVREKFAIDQLILHPRLPALFHVNVSNRLAT